MKARGVLVLFLAGSLAARAQDDTVTMPDWSRARNNGRRKISTRTFSTRFPRWTTPRCNNFSATSSSVFKATTWWTWRRCGKRPTVLPLLESREETQPYAAWLKARMDYLDVADEIRLTIPPPKVETNQPPRSGSQSPAAKGTRALGEKSFRRSLAGPGKRICAGVEADFRRAKDSAGTGLGGGSGIGI
jgi:hypothetical protein